MHSIDRLVLEEKLVILGNGDEEENGGDVFKAVDPFLSLGPLTTHVEHAVSQFADDEGCFGYAGGFDTRPQDVLIAGKVVGLRYACNRVEVTKDKMLENPCVSTVPDGMHHGMKQMWSPIRRASHEQRINGYQMFSAKG